MNEDVIINVRVQLLKAKANLNKTLNEQLKKAVPDFYAVAKAQQAVYQKQKELDSALGKRPFQAWALSIMFFGMALQRTFNSIYNSSSRAFQEVMHSVYGTVTAYDNLNGSLMYLGFVVGEALAPFIQWVSEIVLKVADWASEHQSLVAGILLTVGALGTLLALGGGIVLAEQGIEGLGIALGKIGIAGDALMAIDWPLALGIAAAAFLIKSLHDTPEAMNALSTTMSSVKKTVSGAFYDIGFALGTVLTALLGMTTGETEVAWAFAFVADIAARSFNVIIDVIRMAVNELSLVIEYLKSAYYYATAFLATLGGDERGANIALTRAVASIQNAQVAMQRLNSSTEDFLGNVKAISADINLGPEGFIKRQQAALAVAASTKTAISTPSFTQPISGFINTPQLIMGSDPAAGWKYAAPTFNITNNVSVDNRTFAEQVLAALDAQTQQYRYLLGQR